LCIITLCAFRPSYYTTKQKNHKKSERDRSLVAAEEARHEFWERLPLPNGDEERLQPCATRSEGRWPCVVARVV
jgi:hypothetical protein